MAATSASPAAKEPVRNRAAAYPAPHSTRQSATPGKAENCAAVSRPLMSSLADSPIPVMTATVRPVADNRLPEPAEGVWDKFVGDSRVTWADLDGLSACRCQTRVQAAPAWLRGCCQISSQRPLACWQRRVRMPVAPGWDQCMPESFRRCPTIALHPASTFPEPVEHAGGAEARVRHPVRVVLEVAQGRVQCRGFHPGERERAGGGRDGAGVAVAGVGETLGEPF